VGNGMAEIKGAARQARGGNWRAARRLRRLEKRRLKALDQSKKKNKNKGQ